MPKLSDTELEIRDAGRDLEAELIASLEDARNGRFGAVWIENSKGAYTRSEVAKVRLSMQLSQSKFAELLGVSKRTLQAWEQGQRKPSGSALSLLKVAAARPDILREVLL